MNSIHFTVGGLKSRKATLTCLVFASACLVLALAVSSPLPAQTANGRISGVVRDQTGGTVAGAMVTVTDVARGLTRNLTTDDAGAYLAPNLLPGSYAVRVTFTGFQAWERSNILLEVGQELLVDAVLLPGAQTQTVTVTEELPLVNTTSATLGGTIANEVISDLPISGRNFQNLQELRPGVVLAVGNDSGGGGASQVNGLRPESSNEYLIEGLHIMDPFTGQSIISNIGVNGDQATILPVDAIQEFNAQYNPKAEYGFKAGGSIGVGLKSGTNSLHGTGIAFFRDTALDARNFFNTTDQPKSIGTLQQWGGTLGGPIKKDKLFFFLAFEKQNYEYSNPSSINAEFTDPGMLTCNTSGIGGSPAGSYGCIPNGVVNASTPAAVDATNHLILACLAIKNGPAGSNILSPQSLSLAGLNPDCSPGSKYPNPTFFVPHGASDHGAGRSGNPTITTYFPHAIIDTMALGSIAKLDYQVNAQNSFSGFFFKGVGWDHDCQTCVNPDWRRIFGYYALTGAGSWTWLPTPSSANSLRIGYAKLDQPNDALDQLSGLSAAQLGINTGVVPIEKIINAGIPQISMGSSAYPIGAAPSERQGPETTLEFNDQVSYLLGRHSLKFGGALIAEHTNGGFFRNGNGSFSFTSVPGFFAGQNPVPTIAVSGGTPLAAVPKGGLSSVSLGVGSPRTHQSRNVYSAFIQDDYRIRSRLTLNLGLRYETAGTLHDRDNTLGGFNPNLGMTQEGINTPRIYDPDRKDFSPRIGFAWDVQGNGKTVVRAGGSIIYELITLRTFLDITPALNALPTGFVIGCAGSISATVPAGTIGDAARSNCNGTLFTSGGTNTTAVTTFSTSTNTMAAIHWDGPITGTAPTILPATTTQNCNPNIIIIDGNSARPGTPCTVNFADPHLTAPYVEGWSLSVERALRSNVSLDVAYVGNHGVDLIGKTDLNQTPSNIPGVAWNAVIPGTGPTAGMTLEQVCESPVFGMTISTCDAGKLSGSAFAGAGNCFGAPCSPVQLYNGSLQAARPFAAKFPYLQTINMIHNRDVSRYNALQTTLTMRNYHGLTATAGYTWSHGLGIGNNNTDGVATDAYNRNLDYGAVASDLRHRFTFAPIYKLPERKGFGGLLQGWRINANFKYQTGRPWTATDSRDFYGTGKAGRWDFFGDYRDFAVNLPGQGNPGYYPGCPTAACNTLPAGINPRTGLAFVASDLAVNNPLCAAHAASLATLTAFGCWVQGNSVLTPPHLNRFANSTKGQLRGPIFWQLDSSLSKTQRFTERLSAEFRAEFYNLFNHPMFAQGGGSAATSVSLNSCTLGACTFGTTSTTPNVAATNVLIGSGGQRRVALGVKLIF